MASPTIGRTIEDLPAIVPEVEYPPWDDSWLENPLAVAEDPSPSTSSISLFDLFHAVEFQYNFGLQVPPPPPYPQDNSYDEVEIAFNFAPLPLPPFFPRTPVTFPLYQPPLAPFPQNPFNSYRPRYYPLPLMAKPRFPLARSFRPSPPPRSFAPPSSSYYPERPVEYYPSHQPSSILNL